MHRLAIVDAVHGEQPFQSLDGLVSTILNGEIYNYKELRKDLYSFFYLATNCDT
jgi:asparagine synthase (glutamine-hydrolysing)